MREKRDSPLSISYYLRNPHGGAVQADGITSANTVGYTAQAVEANHWYMIGAQFQGITGANLEVELPTLLSMDLKPGTVGDGESDPTYNNAPMIQVLNADGLSYTFYYYVDDAGVTGDDDDPWNKTGWIDGGTYCLTHDKINLAKGFWFYTYEKGNVNCAGQVCAVDTYEKDISKGVWQIVANPYPIALGLNDITTSGFTPGTVGDGESDPTYNNAPMIQVLNADGLSYTFYYYVDDAGVTGDDDDPWNKTGWIDGGTYCLCSGKQVPVGQAFWIDSAASAGKFTLDITK